MQAKWQQKANFDDEVSGWDIRFLSKFSCYYPRKSCFCSKIFLKPDTQVSGLKTLSHFCKRFSRIRISQNIFVNTQQSQGKIFLSGLIHQSNNHNKNFRVFSCLFVVKNWVVGASPPQAFSCFSWSNYLFGWGLNRCH